MRPRVALGLLIVAVVLWPAWSADKPSDKADKTAELKEKVKAFVAQLADKDPDKQDAAAAEILKLGPDALPHLPRPGDKLTDNQRKSLAVVRKTLRDQQIKRDLSPRLFTYDGEISFTKALIEIAKQTGVEVEDRREIDEDPKIRLKLKDASFWQTIDAVAAQSDARVSIYERDGLVALRRRMENYVMPPVSYNGIFRTTVRRIAATRDFDSDTSTYVATLEMAWEPRFRPFILELNPPAMSFEDDKGRMLSGEDEERNKLAVTSKSSIVFDVTIPAMQRASAQLGLLKGTVSLIGPTRMDTFTFESIEAMQKNPRAREVTQEGVTVKMSTLDIAKDHWTLIVGLEYPADGPQFESFESWLVYNEMLLKKADGKETFPNNGGYSIDSSAGNRAILSYHFVDEKSKSLVRGSPADWTVQYKTPGLIVEVPASFEFKKLALP